MSKLDKIRDKREIAQSEAWDKTAKIISGLVPSGTAAYELLTTIVAPLHEKKRQEFINDLAHRIYKLESAGKIDIQQLAESEEFNTIITKAILLAQQNHQKEKTEAFRNIVLNSIEWLSNGEPIFDWSHKFLMVVDEISPLHILLLETFQNPEKAAREQNVNFDEMVSASNKEVFFKIYPDLKDRSALANQCWKELYSYGFVVTDEFEDFRNIEVMAYMHNHGKLISHTTDFGNKFLRMIEERE